MSTPPSPQDGIRAGVEATAGTFDRLKEKFLEWANEKDAAPRRVLRFELSALHIQVMREIKFLEIAFQDVIDPDVVYGPPADSDKSAPP